MTDQTEVAMLDAISDFMAALNDHIDARVHYERDGPRYAGDNPPDQSEIESALRKSVLAVVRAGLPQ